MKLLHLLPVYHDLFFVAAVLIVVGAIIISLARFLLKNEVRYEGGDGPVEVDLTDELNLLFSPSAESMVNGTALRRGQNVFYMSSCRGLQPAVVVALRRRKQNGRKVDCAQIDNGCGRFHRPIWRLFVAV
jgi:hypothetical protein